MTSLILFASRVLEYHSLHCTLLIYVRWLIHLVVKCGDDTPAETNFIHPKSAHTPRETVKFRVGCSGHISTVPLLVLLGGAIGVVYG